MKKKNVSRILHHLGEEHFPEHAVSPPIYQSSIFCFPNFAEFRDALTDELSHSLYTRGNNPTVMLAEEKIAALEGAERAKLVSSGVAAISHAVMAFLKSGDHAVCVEDCYGWTRTLLSSYLGKFGVTVSYVDGSDSAELLRALRPETRIIFLESPTSLTFKLQNLPEIAAEARKRGIKTIVDNTWATPIFCNPISMGMDIVVHSGSKYLGGASDIIAGVICGTKEDIDLIQKQEFLQLGTVPDPFMAWLMIRGMRTLHIRMKTHYASTLRVAGFLEQHPKVEDVLYPMLDSFSQRDLARSLFSGGSGLFSFRLKTRRVEDVIRFTDSLSMFKRAVSWGGYESLILPNAAKYGNPGDIPPDRIGLVRVHIGLEEAEDLLEDLSTALEKIS